jgi:hypothetical protein
MLGIPTQMHGIQEIQIQHSILLFTVISKAIKLIMLMFYNN